MMMPPIASMGADSSIVHDMRMSICTCCTSFVLRVMRLAAPNRCTSCSLKSPTLAKMSARRSRPARIARRAPKRIARMFAATWPTLSPSIRKPSRQMRSVSPTSTPSSMMSALIVGSMSDSTDWANWNSTTRRSGSHDGLT
jgi:hypothetical protein